MSRLLKLKRQVIAEANKRVLNEQESGFKKSIDVKVDCDAAGVENVSINFSIHQVDENSYNIKILNKSDSYFDLTDFLSWHLDHIDGELNAEIIPNKDTTITLHRDASGRDTADIETSFAFDGEPVGVNFIVKFEDGGLIKFDRVDC